MMFINLEVGKEMRVLNIEKVLSRFQLASYEINCENQLIEFYMSDYFMACSIRLNVKDCEIFTDDYTGPRWDVFSRLKFRYSASSNLNGIKLFVRELMHEISAPFILSFDFAITYAYRKPGEAALIYNVNSPDWLIFDEH